MLILMNRQDAKTPSFEMIFLASLRLGGSKNIPPLAIRA
jgi:hypothetical protein